MANTTPSDQDILNGLRQAYYNLAISGAQSYSINGRTFTRFDIDALSKQIAIWERRVAAASGGGIGGTTVLVTTH